MKEKYDPKQIEEPIYNFWQDSSCFTSKVLRNGIENYCIMMPPPNITGGLHLGHAFQQTIMDILVRYRRMQGKNTLWLAGFDHAGIATQILVENNIYKKTGKHKKDYNEDFLLNQIWSWKQKSEKLISYQMKRLGNSIDWDKQRFTMDSNMSFSVREAFIRLYKNNFIYKGKRLVNWDSSLQTVISDLEVSHRSIQGYMWYIRYKLEKNVLNYNFNDGYVIVATTRPETMLGDVAIAVHPQDSRYNKLINSYVLIPIINRKIPIISDINIDFTKGTGCVKITPAHDFNDYIIAKKHKLYMINIFSSNRKILKEAELFDSQGQFLSRLEHSIPKDFQDLDYDQARQYIVEECKRLNLLEDTKVHSLSIPYNSRTDTIIEPMLTDQWYIRMKDLSKQAICMVKNDIIDFIPKKYKNMYFKWMEDIQDWCISRQICWGHEIPAWYDDQNGLVYVGHCERSVRIDNKLSNDIILRKDKDVLDTWFSSSLWTFSSLGWPHNTDLLNIFHPTDIVVSGFDIIFFWIARMIMMTMYFIKDKYGNPQIPFKKVYITGLVRDDFGKKMSKSKGNIVDPIDIIDGISIGQLLKKRICNLSDKKSVDSVIKFTKKQFSNGIKAYGADSLRLTLAALSSSGRDINWDMNRLKGYHNFCNKLWNAGKFIFFHTLNQDCGLLSQEKLLSSADKWIVTKLHQTIQDVSQSLENCRFDKMVNVLYEFIWHQFCDWYIEFTKPILYHDKDILKLRNTRYTLITSFEVILRLAHPIIPFITERLWQTVKTIMQIDDKTIMLQSFPKYNSALVDLKSVDVLEWVKNIIFEIRMLRTFTGMLYNAPLRVAFKCISKDIRQYILENYNILMHMACLKNIDFLEYHEICNRFFLIPLSIGKLLVFVPSTFNKCIAINKINKEIELVDNKIRFIKEKLNDNNIHTVFNDFLNKYKEKLNYYNVIREKLINHYAVIKKL